jgi:hypothetical protein
LERQENTKGKTPAGFIRRGHSHFTAGIRTRHTNTMKNPRTLLIITIALLVWFSWCKGDLHAQGTATTTPASAASSMPTPTFVPESTSTRADQSVPPATSSAGVALLFAEETIAKMNGVCITFAPDGRALYFAAKGIIYQARLENGAWASPTPVSFSGQFRDGDPFLSPDGSRLFFWSRRQTAYNDLWMVSRTEAGWGEPNHLAAPVNLPGIDQGHPMVTSSGSLYFMGRRPGGKGGTDIYRSKRINGEFAEPENLGDGINSPYEEMDPFVGPDERWMVWASDRPGGFGNLDLYISSFTNGSWTAPRNLGPTINTNTYEYCPRMSLDGKSFLFSRDQTWQIGAVILGVSE